MRKPKVEEEELLAGLMSVLRAKGYDGASLNELAASSGLQKASLYHRFPGGKKQIAEAVLSYVGEWVNKNIYGVLADQSISAQERLSKVIENIRVIYGNGEKICLLRALSMDSGMELFGQQINQGMNRWIEGFTLLGQDFGFSVELAESKAIKVLMLVQGGLVVAKGVGKLHPFDLAMKSISNLYLE